jgi:hypothetical protein
VDRYGAVTRVDGHMKWTDMGQLLGWTHEVDRYGAVNQMDGHAKKWIEMAQLLRWTDTRRSG